MTKKLTLEELIAEISNDFFVFLSCARSRLEDAEVYENEKAPFSNFLDACQDAFDEITVLENELNEQHRRNSDYDDDVRNTYYDNCL